MKKQKIQIGVMLVIAVALIVGYTVMKKSNEEAKKAEEDEEYSEVLINCETTDITEIKIKKDGTVYDIKRSDNPDAADNTTDNATDDADDSSTEASSDSSAEISDESSAETVTEAETDAETDADAETEAETETDTETDTDTAVDTEAIAETDSETETEDVPEYIWTLEDGSRITENGSDTMCSTLAGLTAVDKLSSDKVSDYADFGLDDESIIVEVTYSDKTITLKIGDKNEITDSYYVLVDNEEDIYLTETNLAATFDVDIDSLKES